VKRLHTIASRTVKVDIRAPHEAPFTAKGGLALFEALALLLDARAGPVARAIAAMHRLAR